MKKATFACLFASGILLSPTSVSAAPEEHLLRPDYVVTFEGDVAYDALRQGYSRVGADTRPNGAPIRTVLEFPLPSVTDAGEIQRAHLSILTDGGFHAEGPLQYALFAFGGDGILSAGEGLGGTQLAGPFAYDRDTQSSDDPSEVNALAFVRQAIEAGHTHAGFALRDVNTEPFFRSDQRALSARKTQRANTRSPLLVIHVDRDPNSPTALPAVRKDGLSGRDTPRPPAPGAGAADPLASSGDASPERPKAERGTGDGPALDFLYWSFNTMDSEIPYQDLSEHDHTNALIGRGCLRANNLGYYYTYEKGIEGSLPRSISIWFRTDSNTGTQDALIGWGPTFDWQDGRYDFRIDGSNLRVEAGNAGHTFTFATNVRDGAWHHALLTYTGGRLSNHRLYVDGKYAGRATSSTVPDTDNWRDISIGSGNQRAQGGNATGRDFSGWIDDVGVFARELTAFDGALIHGLGRIHAIDLARLEDFRALWEGPRGGTLEMDGKLWIRAARLPGSLGDTGGSWETNDAYIVLDSAGNGIRVAPHPRFEQFQVVDGDLDLNLGFGKDTIATPSLINTGSTALWRVLWEDHNSRGALDATSINLERHRAAFLDLVPDRRPFEGGETGDSIGPGFGFYDRDGGNYLFFDGERAPYTGGAIVEQAVDQGTARFFTSNYGSFFTMVADLQGVPSFSVAADYYVLRSSALLELPVTAADGTPYRAFVQHRWLYSNHPQLYEVILVPDVEGLVVTESPFKISSLPASIRVHYLMFGRQPEQGGYSRATLEDVLESYLASIAKGVSWAWTTPSRGEAIPLVGTPISLSVDTLPLSPGSYTTRYAITPLDTPASEVPESAWHQIHLNVGEPDFAIPTPDLSVTALGGAPTDVVPVTLEPLVGSEVTVHSLASDQAWLTPEVSTKHPNQVDLHIDTGSLPVGTYRATVTIDSASTRRLLKVHVTIEAQNIIALHADYHRNRIYALHQPPAGEGRLLVLNGHDASWIGAMPLEEKVTDLSLRPDGSELLVLHRSGSLWSIDPDTLEVNTRNDFSSHQDWKPFYSAEVCAGAGSAAYLRTGDEHFVGNMLVVDTSAGEILQTFEEVTAMTFHGGRSELFTWMTSTHNAVIERFAADESGRLTSLDSYAHRTLDYGFTDTTRRVQISRDGSRLIVNNREINPDDLQEHRAEYVAATVAMSANAEVITGTKKILDRRTQQELFELPEAPGQSGGYLVQEISADSSRIFYFDHRAELLKSVDLVAAVGEEALGIRYEPADQSTVLSPEFLRWKPSPGARQYHVYLADSAEALANPGSAQLIASTFEPWLKPTTDWEPGRTYYWRVDTVTVDGDLTAGPVLSFQISNLSVDQRSLYMFGTPIFGGQSEFLQVDSADLTHEWTVTSNQPWLVPVPASGTGAAEVEIRMTDEVRSNNTSDGEITISQGQESITIPVTIWFGVFYLKHVLADPEQPFTYLFFDNAARSGVRGSSLVRYNLETQSFDKVAGIPDFVRSFAMHPTDRKLSIAYSYDEGTPSIATLDLDRFRVTAGPVEVRGLGSENGSLPGSALIAGPAGHVFLSDKGSWLIDTGTMTVTATVMEDYEVNVVHNQAYDATNDILYLDVTGADGQRRLMKYRLEGTEPVRLASSDVSGHSYQRFEPLLLSENGSRLCRRDQLYDSDLKQVLKLNTDTYSSSYPFRPIAFTADDHFVTDGVNLFNTHNGLLVSRLDSPASDLRALTYDGRHLFHSDWQDITTAKLNDLHALTALGEQDITTNIPDDSIRFSTLLPLTWQHDPGAIRYQVYLGTDADVLANAGPESPEFLGETGEAAIAPAIPLDFDQQYFWRIDVIGFDATRQGGIHSFHTASINAAPLDFSFAGPIGVPLPGQGIALDAPDPVAWTAETSTPWIRLVDTSGTTPATLRFEFLTNDLAVGHREGSISLSTGGRSWDYPVSLTLEETNITIARIDPETGLIYGISQSDDQAPEDATTSAGLIEYDPTTGQALRFAPVGTSAGDLRIDPDTNRIYVANWKSGKLRVLDRTTLEELQVFSFTPLDPERNDTGDAFSLAVGPDGTVVMGEASTPSELRLVDTNTGSLLDTWSPVPLALGAGRNAFLPGGPYLLHSEREDGLLYKIDTSGNTFTPVAEAIQPENRNTRFPSSPVVVTGDGSRIFANLGVFDSDLNLLQVTPDTVLAVSSGGDIAITERGIWNLRNNQTVSTHSFNWNALVFAEKQDKIWFFQPNEPVPFSQDLAAILGLDPDGDINPKITEDSIVIGSSQTLEWEHDPLALAYDVYFGSDPDALASATMDSPEFLGSTVDDALPTPAALTLGARYFWRVDVRGHFATRKGGLHSFHVAPVEVSPNTLRINALAGVPVPDQELAISAGTPTSWSATTSDAWIEILTPTGTTPETLRIALDTSSLREDRTTYGSIQLDAGGRVFDLPVRIYVAPFQIRDVTADRERPLLYAVTGVSQFSSKPSFLVLIDAITEEPLRAIELGFGYARHVMIHYPENRIYVSNSTKERITGIDRDSFDPVNDLDSPPTPQPGALGRIALTGSSNLERVHLLDSNSGALLSTSFFDGFPYYWDLKGGSGSFDPMGRWFYYGEKDGDLLKFDTGDDQLHCVSSHVATGDSGTGAFPEVLQNDDGSRVFWGGRVLDPDLNLLWNFSDIEQPYFRNNAVAIDRDGVRLFTRDDAHVIRVFDTRQQRLLFQLHDANGHIVYSEPTGKLFDITNNSISSVIFAQVVEPASAPPGLTWASGGAVPWVPAPEEGPGVMVTTTGPWGARASRCALHLPGAATVWFQARGRLTAFLGARSVASINSPDDWEDVQIDVPDGGHYITWSGQAYNEDLRGFVRNIAVMRDGPILPVTTDPDPGSTPVDTDLDSDGDGSPDLIEWAAGGRINDADLGPAIIHFVEDGEFVFQFERRLDMEGATLVVEGSGDLVDWHELTFPDVLQVDINAIYETLEARIPIGGQYKFLRLKAQAPFTP